MSLPLGQAATVDPLQTSSALVRTRSRVSDFFFAWPDKTYLPKRMESPDV